jgi:Na+/H+ antiporter NhaC
MRQYLFTASIVFIVIFLFIGSRSCYAQQTERKEYTKEDYLKKSKNQKNAAWVMLGIAAVPILVAAPGNASFGTAEALVLVSGVAVITSTSLFIASGVNKRKARKISASFRLPEPIYLSKKASYTPQLVLKIPI